ncbi:MAG: PAS domain S-box protein [Gemmatimonadota bacterium]
MAPESVTVLIVDDDREDAELVEDLLADASTSVFKIFWVPTYEEGLAAIGGPEIDVCLVDSRLGARTGLDFLEEAGVRASDVPVVMLTDEGSTDLDREAMRAGAADYLPKADLTTPLLERAIGHALERARRVRDEAHIRFQADLLDAVGQAVIATDVEGHVTYWNQAAERIYGWSGEEAVGRSILELTPTETSRVEAERVMTVLRGGGTWSGEFEVRRRDGTEFLALVTNAPIHDASGDFVGIVGVSSDVSKRKATEDALRERVKELRTLHATGQLLNRKDLSIRERLERIVHEIPSGWTVPEATEARLTLGGRTFATPDFRETSWMLTAPVPFGAAGETGLLEVALTRERAARDGVPFLKEEKELIDHLGLLIGETVARERATQLLSQTLSSLEEAVVILDSAGSERRVRYVNPAGERMFGYTWDEFVGDTPEKAHLDPASFERFGSMAMAALDEGKTFRGTFTLRRKNGTLFEAEQTVSLLDPQRGIEGGIVTAVRDVTRQVRTEAALRESEERFRQIAEHIDAVFWITPPDKSRMEYVSPAYTKVWGRSPEALYRDPATWLEAVLPEDRARVQQAATQQGEGGYDETYRIQRPDGDVRWIHDRAFTVTDEEGTVTRIVGVAEDITDRRLAEERFRVLGEEMADVIIVIAPDGTVLFTSPSVESLTGYSHRAFLGMNALDIIHPEDRNRVTDVLTAVAGAPEENVRVEHRVMRQDGQMREVESVARNLLLHPAVRGIVVTTRDVSERLVLERRVRQGQKMEAIGRLAGGIAHDFNNILTVIRSETELLLLENPSNPMADDLEAIRSAADRAAVLTSQLLAFSREQVLRPRLVELGAVVRGFASMIERVAGEHSSVRYDLPEGLDPVHVDPDQLEQVVMNLVANARDAMSQGGVLSISTAVEDLTVDDLDNLPGLTPGRYAVLRVADTGTGMSPETTRRIFDPFFTTKPTGKGTGLGLAMAYGFMKQSGGGIHVDTEVGKGATFHLRFPVMARKREAVIAEPDEPVTGVVLLVEDDPSVRNVTERVLERGGFKVHATDSAQQALELLESGQPIDLVLTDLSLPGESGHVVARRAREHEPELPVLVMSGQLEDTAGDGEALPDGTTYLQKPFTRDQLLEAVRAALGRRTR